MATDPSSRATKKLRDQPTLAINQSLPLFFETVIADWWDRGGHSFTHNRSEPRHNA